LSGPLHSLEHLRTGALELSDIYGIFRNQISPRLRTLHLVLISTDAIAYRVPAKIRPIPLVSDLSLPVLKILSMDLRRFTGVEWASVEPLTSSLVVPNLRHCTLIYELYRPMDLRSIFASSLFVDRKRNIQLRFAIHLLSHNTLVQIEDPINLHEIHTKHHNETYCEYVSQLLFISAMILNERVSSNFTLKKIT
jgi:hypothetical protein